jgi:hypothetical protein
MSLKDKVQQLIAENNILKNESKGTDPLDAEVAEVEKELDNHLNPPVVAASPSSSMAQPVDPIHIPA